MIVTLVDGWSAFAAEYNDLAGSAVLDAFVRVLADGPELRMYTVVAADRALAVPSQLASLVRQRMALRLADRNDYTSFGIRSGAVPEMVAGTGAAGRDGPGGADRPARRRGLAARPAAPGRGHAAGAGDPPLRDPIASLATAVRLAELAGRPGSVSGPGRCPSASRSAPCRPPA